MSACEHQRSAAVAALKGELKGLEIQRWEAHRARCRSCRGVHRELSIALKAEQHWTQVREQQVELLVEGLRPEMEACRVRQRGDRNPLLLALALSGAAFAVAVLVFLGGGAGKGSTVEG